MPHQLEREYANGQLTRLSLGLTLVDQYLDFLRCRCRYNTWLNYAHDLKVFFDAIDKPVIAVSTADVFRFIECQQQAISSPAQKSRTGSVCIRTLKRRLSAVSGLYSYLLTRGDTPIQRNPVPSSLYLRGRLSGDKPRGVPLLRAPQTLPRVVPVEQIQKFVGSLNSYRDKAMVLLMALGGLRKSEVLALDESDFNPERGTVRVREGKGGHERICCVAPLFFQVLARYLREERPTTSVTRLFLVMKGPQRGQPLSVSGLNTIIAHHRRLAETPRLTCHGLRHTCLTLLREAGMSLEALQLQAGHQSINTTRVYIHLTDQVLRQEYFRVSDQLFPSGASEVPHA